MRQKLAPQDALHDVGMDLHPVHLSVSLPAAADRHGKEVLVLGDGNPHENDRVLECPVVQVAIFRIGKGIDLRPGVSFIVRGECGIVDDVLKLHMEKSSAWVVIVHQKRGRVVQRNDASGIPQVIPFPHRDR